MSSVKLVYLQLCTIYTLWLLSAFKPNVPISIQAWLLLKHTRHTLGASLSTDIPKCLIGYHWYLRLLASHRLDPGEALNLGSVCSRQLHGNTRPCIIKWEWCELSAYTQTSQGRKINKAFEATLISYCDNKCKKYLETKV